MTHVFYGETGQPVACFGPDRCFYLFDGTPVAWLARSGDVHAFDGRYLGWLQEGALWDPAGRCALFSSEANGSPRKPSVLPAPARTERRRIPNRQAPERPPGRPRRSGLWADVTDEGFFCPLVSSDVVRKQLRRSPLMR